MNTQQSLSQAFQHLNSGNVLAAATLFEAVLQQEPTNFSALNGRGFVALQQNRLAQSAADFEQSLKVNPRQAFAQKMLGIVLGAMGRFDESMDAFAAALELDGKDPEVYFNRANFRFQAGQVQEALSDLDIAIKLRGSYLEARSNRANLLIQMGDFVRAEKDLDYLVGKVTNNPDIWVALGLAKHKIGKQREAMQCNERALKLVPNHPDALLNSSSAAFEQAEYAAALSWAERAVAVTPNRAEAYYALAKALSKLNDFSAAEIAYQSGLTISPGYLECWIGLGLVKAATMAYSEAISCYRHALRINPANLTAMINMGFALKEIGDFEAAQEMFRQVIRIDPLNAKAYNNLGIISLINRDPVEALRIFSDGLMCEPEDPGLLFSLSTTLLATGDYAAGWSLFESRHLKARNIKTIAGPVWTGKEDLTGKTLLILAEEGLGDTLQFCRFVNQATDRCEKLFLCVQKPLVDLCATLNSKVMVLESHHSIPDFDMQIPLMSLPRAIGITLENLPNKCPYLFADRGKMRAWHEKLCLNRDLNVGLVWSGGVRPEEPNYWAINARRNIPIEKLSMLGGLGVRFVSLQVGEDAVKELRFLSRENPFYQSVIDPSKDLKDFTDTAALIENLDLVISVDTAVAHLAGALGKPVWLLNRYDSCWRWLIDREDSPWYPSIKIYNQNSYGNWDSVLQKVKSDLIDFVRKKG